MQNKYQVASEISFLASRIIGKKGNAYCELIERPNGATIKTIFFNGGTMKISIKYTPDTHPCTTTDTSLTTCQEI